MSNVYPDFSYLAYRTLRRQENGESDPKGVNRFLASAIREWPDSTRYGQRVEAPLEPIMNLFESSDRRTTTFRPDYRVWRALTTQSIELYAARKTERATLRA